MPELPNKKTLLGKMAGAVVYKKAGDTARAKARVQKVGQEKKIGRRKGSGQAGDDNRRQVEKGSQAGEPLTENRDRKRAKQKCCKRKKSR